MDFMLDFLRVEIMFMTGEIRDFLRKRGVQVKMGGGYLSKAFTNICYWWCFLSAGLFKAYFNVGGIWWLLGEERGSGDGLLGDQSVSFHGYNNVWNLGVGI
jgi:hypothetical protein